MELTDLHELICKYPYVKGETLKIPLSFDDFASVYPEYIKACHASTNFFPVVEISLTVPNFYYQGHVFYLKNNEP